MEKLNYKITYTERVRLLAEKMAKASYDKMNYSIPWDRCSNKYYYYSKKMEDARIAIAETAEAVIIYAFGSLEDYKQLVEQGQEFDYMDRVLKEQGLIPDSAQEGSHDANV